MGTTNEPAAETAPGNQRSARRPLFEPPRLRTYDRGDRETTWLELFFDLVFVVVVDQVARRLEGPITLSTVAGFAVLAVPVWWAWVGYVYYVDRFGTDDLRDRLITLAQMGAATAIALRAHDALGKGAAGFAIAYAVFRLLLVFDYALAAWYIPEARSLATRFALGFAIAALLWLISAWVPSPVRFWLWGVGFVIDFATPLTAGRLNAKLPLNSEHLQERFGNFTLIVIGEGIVGVIEGLRDFKWAPGAAAVAALSFAVGFALWWVYFETSDGAPVEAVGEGHTGPYLAWVYAHLPFIVGIGAAAMGVGHAIHDAPLPTLPDPTRWLFAGAIALCFVGLAIINLAYAASGVAQCNRVQSLWMLVTAAVALGVAALGNQLSAVGVFGIIAFVSVAQVGVDLWYSARAAER